MTEQRPNLDYGKRYVYRGLPSPTSALVLPPHGMNGREFMDPNTGCRFSQDGRYHIHSCDFHDIPSMFDLVSEYRQSPTPARKTAQELAEAAERKFWTTHGPIPDPEPVRQRKPKRQVADPETTVVVTLPRDEAKRTPDVMRKWAHSCRVAFVTRVVRKMTKTPRPGVLFCEQYFRCVDTLASGQDKSSRGYSCSVHWLQRVFPKIASLIESYIAKEIRDDNSIHGIGGHHGWSGPHEYVAKPHSINHSHDWYLWQEPEIDDSVKIYERDTYD